VTRFAGRTTAELSNLTVGLDQLLASLSNPAYATLRRSALRRWPVPTKAVRTTKQRC
jgi:hypothetical protein